jgi:hypothetical protein
LQSIPRFFISDGRYLWCQRLSYGDQCSRLLYTIIDQLLCRMLLSTNPHIRQNDLLIHRLLDAASVLEISSFLSAPYAHALYFGRRHVLDISLCTRPGCSGHCFFSRYWTPNLKTVIQTSIGCCEALRPIGRATGGTTLFGRSCDEIAVQRARPPRPECSKVLTHS